MKWSSFQGFFSGRRWYLKASCRVLVAMCLYYQDRPPDMQHSCEKFHSTPVSSLCVVHVLIIFLTKRKDTPRPSSHMVRQARMLLPHSDVVFALPDVKWEASCWCDYMISWRIINVCIYIAALTCNAAGDCSPFNFPPTSYWWSNVNLTVWTLNH